MFQLPDEIKKQISNYEAAIKEFAQGKSSWARFAAVRVPWGNYSHRGGKIFMSRLRIPAGSLNPAQLRAIAFCAKNYGNGAAHITTRQDIQIHEVRLENIIKIHQYLKDYELSSRGGGGNTVRNITACDICCICKDENFEVCGYAQALSEYLLRQESSYNLPRKFKIAFSGCPRDCAAVLVNDLGFVAKYQSSSSKGFKVFAGGGMGKEPRLGKLLEEFIFEEDLGYCTEAVKNVFYKNGDRRNKHHNRLRFLIEALGFEKFKELYRAEFKDLKENAHIVLRKIDTKGDTFLKKSVPFSAGEIPQVEDKDYKEFLKYSVRPQKQKGFSMVQLRITCGDITAEELTGLADLEKDFGRVEFSTTQNQNIFIAWVKNQDIYKLFLKLKEIFPDFFYPGTLLDIVACKGALTCNLGLCNSPGLAKEVEQVIKKNFIGKRVFDELEIKINGCPNACGQHPIGKIAFYGVAKRVDNRPVPFYRLLIGGRKAEERTRFAGELGVIPAKNVPVFLKEFLTRTETKLNKKTDIHTFLAAEAIVIAKELLNKFSYVPPYSQDKDFYIDWGKTEEFSLTGLGPGECGAGILDMIDSDLTDAKVALEEAEKKGPFAKKLKKAFFLSSRALLVVKGSDPKTEDEALSDFKKKFVEAGIADSAYSNLKEVFAGISDNLKDEEKEEKFLYVKGFFGHIKELYQSMDSAFNFKQKKEAEAEKPVEAMSRLDLKGVACPMNYVKTKLFLEGLNSGDILEVFLDEGEPIDNVPKSLVADGHQVLKIEKFGGHYRVVVKKGQVR